MLIVDGTVRIRLFIYYKHFQCIEYFVCKLENKESEKLTGGITYKHRLFLENNRLTENSI